MYRRIIVPFIIMISLCVHTFADDHPPVASEPMDRLRQMQRNLSKSFSAKGSFHQDFLCDGTKAEAVYSGTFEVKRKGRYRFTYSEPPGILLISDGTETFLYDKNENIVIIDHPSDVLPAAIGHFLLGGTVDEFTAEKISSADDPEKTLSVYRLEPSDPHPFVLRILLTLSDKLPFINRISIVDPNGCIIRTTFNNVQLDTGIPNRRFHFIPPKTAVIINP
jgi:outer membrane lipoprotein-sorting protein